MNERIHIGVGGWTFEPWRDNFYPKGLPHKEELAYASRHLTAIEINGTFYSTFKPAQFAKWRDETPEGFVFSLKAHRFATYRRDLSTAREPIERFVGSGIAELRDKLGPIVWQLMPSAKFDADNVGAFFAMLPKEAAGRPLKHVLDARHESFDCEPYFELAERYGVGTVHSDSDDYPGLADAGSELAYLRLMRTSADCPTGYPTEEIAKWVQGARAWAGKGPGREVFMYFISGAKERNPAAAMEALRLLAG
ncbi:MAG TPA: DUF72 domain-containing protein [Ramlibacter sp.]|uniref:DUF72 domain-containing protein n=1 Tax=Ramlibacter sp. TaxID=1917967 RepID=UPI002C62A139|nr:DUF72 domain-containing protein [Ramlibacter sp.]HVZ46953.1 DUF72 domain-containing protein [Ramlibacter sp.]